MFTVVSGTAIALWCLQESRLGDSRRGLPLGTARPEIAGVEPNVAVFLPVRGWANLSRLLPLLRAQE